MSNKLLSDGVYFNNLYYLYLSVSAGVLAAFFLAALVAAAHSSESYSYDKKHLLHSLPIIFKLIKLYFTKISRLFAKNAAKVQHFLDMCKKNCNFAQLILHFMEKKGFFDKSDLKIVGFNIVLAVIVGIAILVGLIIWLKDYTQHGVEVEVEDVRGLVEAEAAPLLEAQGLRLIVVDSTYSDKVPFGTIVEQDPKPLSHAKHGRAVYVTINATTRRQVTMPDLQDMSYRQAETTLRGLGLQVDTIYEYEPSEYKDLVLDVRAGETSLSPGTKVAIGTQVRLVVGQGRGTEMVIVPNVVGMTMQEARSTLLNRHLTIGAVSYDEPKEGTKVQYVYRQTPSAGEKLIEGETVALRFSVDIRKASKNNTNIDQEDEWF